MSESQSKLQTLTTVKCIINVWHYNKPCVQIKRIVRFSLEKPCKSPIKQECWSFYVYGDFFPRSVTRLKQPAYPDIGQHGCFLQLGNTGGARPVFRRHAAWKVFFHSFFTCWLCLLPLRCTVGLLSMTCSSDELHWGSLLPTSAILPSLLESALQQHGDLEPSSQFTGSTSALSFFETFPTILSCSSCYIHVINLQSCIFMDFLQYCNFFLLRTSAAHLRASAKICGEFYFAQVANHRLACKCLVGRRDVPSMFGTPPGNPAWCHGHTEYSTVFVAWMWINDILGSTYIVDSRFGLWKYDKGAERPIAAEYSVQKELKPPEWKWREWWRDTKGWRS